MALFAVDPIVRVTLVIAPFELPRELPFELLRDREPVPLPLLLCAPVAGERFAAVERLVAPAVRVPACFERPFVERVVDAIGSLLLGGLFVVPGHVAAITFTARA